MVPGSAWVLIVITNYLDSLTTVGSNTLDNMDG